MENPTIALDTSLPVVSVVTSHGRQRLHGERHERLIDVLTRNQVPWSAVSIYVKPKGGDRLELRACLGTRLDELGDVSDVLLYFNRNVNPFKFSLAGFSVVDSATPLEPSGTEYIYQELDNQHSSSSAYLKKLSPDECKTVIADRVGDVIKAHLPAGAGIVVGVSGGGDSNSLLHALSRQVEAGLKIHPVIIKGIPDWDLGVPRAQALCDSYGIPLTIIEEQEVKSLLHMAPQTPSLIEAFEREFKGDDFEFVGTLLIRLALSRKARELGTSYICTGLNLEDLLCESLFRISTGLKPAPFPMRQIGSTQLLFPLWLCPKRIIDGCFPKFSLENYDARYPCFSLGRNLYYSIVYALQSQFPGFSEQLARGLSTQSVKDPVNYVYDEQLGFHVERFVPFRLRQQFKRMLGHDQPIETLA
jgi:tRNA(Ile)-lysidine synthase TilS/MesJ